MKKTSIIAVTVSILFISTWAWSSSEHSKKEEKTEHGKHQEHKEHGEEDGHAHGEESEKEAGGNVGPDKGITEFSERNGFKLSPEALNNFDLKFLKLNGDGPWSLPKSALVHSGEEKNIFRKRNDFFKRIDFQVIKSSGDQLTVDSDDLREGDEVVIIGLGFLRIAELAATGGVAHGHSH